MLRRLCLSWSIYSYRQPSRCKYTAAECQTDYSTPASALFRLQCFVGPEDCDDILEVRVAETTPGGGSGHKPLKVDQGIVQLVTACSDALEKICTMATSCDDRKGQSGPNQY